MAPLGADKKGENHERQNEKGYLADFKGGVFSFFIIGCTTVTFDKEIVQFFSKVRPQPGNPGSHYLLACYYQERGRHKEAIEEFKKVILINPDHIKAYNGMGVSYDLLEKFPEAVESYRTALRLTRILITSITISGTLICSRRGFRTRFLPLIERLF